MNAQTVERAKKFLALTDSSNEGEADNARRMLVRLLKREVNPFEQRANDLGLLKLMAKISQLKDEVDLWKRECRDKERRIEDLTEELQRRSRARTSPFNSQPQPEKEKEEEHPWIYIRSKFNTTCTHCREKIPAGDYVYWKKGGGCSHVHCHEARQ